MGIWCKNYSLMFRFIRKSLNATKYLKKLLPLPCVCLWLILQSLTLLSFSYLRRYINVTTVLWRWKSNKEF